MAQLTSARMFGVKNYKSYVGSEKDYYPIGLNQFDLLMALGLRENHKLLDVGCGSLRIGRLLIPYLLPGNYYGVEPETKWQRQGLFYEVTQKFGEKFVKYKAPTFDACDSFSFKKFEVKFDFVMAISVFIHCGRDQFVTCLRNTREVMHNDSIFVLSLDIDSESTHVGVKQLRYRHASHERVSYSQDEVDRIVKDAGFRAEIVRDCSGDSNDKIKRRVFFALRRDQLGEH